jgi:branched-chain amino acid transport system permease protein
LLQLLVAGLSLGAIYALVALGFVLIYRATGMINFAQGDMMTAAAFVALWATRDLHLPILAAWVTAAIALGALGGLMYATIYRPLYNRSLVAVGIATLGVALMLRGLMLIAFGELPANLPSPIEARTIRIGTTVLSSQHVLVIVLATVLVVAQAVVLRVTFLGKSLRAVSENQEVARMLGLRVDRLLLGTIVYGAVLAALAGVLLAPILSVSLNLGWSLALTAFAAAIVGGFGSMPGALFGGMLLGLGEVLANRYIPGGYADSVVFGLVLVVLVLRPAGILSMLPGRRA